MILITIEEIDVPDQSTYIHEYLKINSYLGKYIGRSKMTNFLNSGKTWINMKYMYILTYLSADLWIENLT